MKDKSLSLRVFVFLLYSLFALSSVYSVISGIWFDTFGKKDLESLSIIPYLCNYLIVVWLSQGLNDGKAPNLSLIDGIINQRYVVLGEFFTITLSVLYLVLLYLWSRMFSYLNVGEVYASFHTSDGEVVFPDRIMNVLFFKSKQLLDFLYPFVYLVEFSRLVADSKKVRAKTIILMVYLPLIIGCVLTGNRGGIVFNTTNLLFFIILFWPRLSSKTRKQIVRYGLLFSLVVINFLVYISMSRAGDEKDKALNDALRYFGETFPNMGFNLWNVDGNYLWGQRTFPDVYAIFSDVQSVEGGNQGYYDYFGKISKFPILNFKCLYGDLYCDFGPIFPFFIVCFFIRILNWMKHQLKDSIFGVIIVFFLYKVVVFGLFNSLIDETHIIALFITFFCACFLHRSLSKHYIHK